MSNTSTPSAKPSTYFHAGSGDALGVGGLGHVEDALTLERRVEDAADYGVGWQIKLQLRALLGPVLHHELAVAVGARLGTQKPRDAASRSMDLKATACSRLRVKRENFQTRISWNGALGLLASFSIFWNSGLLPRSTVGFRRYCPTGMKGGAPVGRVSATIAASCRADATAGDAMSCPGCHAQQGSRRWR